MLSALALADSTRGGGGGGGVLSAFGQFNERGEVTVIDRANAHAQYRQVNLLMIIC